MEEIQSGTFACDRRKEVFQHYERKEDYMFSRLAEFELSLLFTNKAAEHRLYLECISIPCEGFKNISKKRRKTQVKSDLERQPQCLSLLTSTICFQ